MVLVFTITVFLSACLLFSIQPMIAKALLPIFGGGSSVWTTCMLFYQSLLLLGYLYAHILMTRFGRSAQMLVHTVVLLTALGAGILFDTPQAPAHASTFPVPWLIWQLLLISGLPFFAISSAGPLIQGWFARTDHPRAHDPYFLYAASNAGSLIGLLAYPLLFEPNLGLSSQRQLWLTALGVFIVLALYTASRTKKPRHLTQKEAKRQRKADRRLAQTRRHDVLETEARGTMVTPSPQSEEQAIHLARPIDWKRRFYWVYLAFIPSSILLGVTTYITTDVVSLPLLWVIPLALYLITMIIAFGSNARRAVKDFTRPMVILVLGTMLLMVASTLNAHGPMVLIVAVELLLLLAIGIVCHGRLALDRPKATHLTEFYLLMSVGGALGGLFNGIVAPLAFNTALEFPIALVLALSVLPWSADLRAMVPTRARRIKLTRRVGIPLLSLAYLLVIGRYGHHIVGWVHGRTGVEMVTTGGASLLLVGLMLSVPMVLVCLAWKDGLACALTVVLPMAAIQYNAIDDKQMIYRARTFYGIHEVTEQYIEDKDGNRPIKVHVIHHGTTIHGIQYLAPQLELRPLGYYSLDGPCGMIMRTLRSMRPDGARIGIMGLGSGAMAAYGRPQDTIEFFEIDPEVERIARDPDLFTFLAKTPAHTKVRLGDGRKLIEESRASGEAKFDMIHADAFSSDSIPTHLLTVEAMNLYLDRITDDGVVVLHISNRYLNLSPLVYELAMATTGIPPLIIEDRHIPDEQRAFRFRSLWMVVVKDPRTAIRIAQTALAEARAENPELTDEDEIEKQSMASVYIVPEEDRIRVWTDDYSNIISLIKWGG